MQRQYSNFRGVDFLNDNVALYRSPNSVNMWKNNGKIETRPGVGLLGEFGLQIFGLFFFDVEDTLQVLVHIGTKLYKWNNYPNKPIMSGEEATVTDLFTGMNPRESQSFIWNNILFIKDGINYLEYDGVEVKSIVGTIPITSRSRTPIGEVITDDNDLVYQDVNLLQPKRKNAFVADGTSKDYYLDTKGLDSSSIYIMTAVVNGLTKVETIDFTVDRVNGIVTFNEAPNKPLQDGESNVIITLSKTISGYADRIKKCTILQEFDKRIFFSGNQDYPNTLFHSELEDPRYIRDTAYYQEGLDLAPINTIIGGNDSLWVLKEPNQANSSVFYHTPTIDYTYGKIYPSQQANISTGCISTGVNFSDDIVFFSNLGMEAINGQINSEKLLAHRSSLVDPKLINEINYNKLKLVEYKGYLMCLVNSKMFLADGRQVFTNELTGEIEYEWYYWELPNSITYIKEYKNNLFMGNTLGELFSLHGDKDFAKVENELKELVFVETDINSKWT